VELFIIQANIERYQSLLLVEQDLRRQAVLRALLAAERDKLRDYGATPSGVDDSPGASFDRSGPAPPT
jgi:hypothetical protein